MEHTGGWLPWKGKGCCTCLQGQLPWNGKGCCTCLQDEFHENKKGAYYETKPALKRNVNCQKLPRRTALT
eukprot:1158219-Pelagomonas_calceolata.AAC.1